MASLNHFLLPAGPALRELFTSGRTLRIMEAHCALSARIAEDAAVSTHSFDALWSSSLCESALLGAPDIELVSIKERVQNCITMQHASSLPIIFDGDTGGDHAHIPYNIRTLERGASPPSCSRTRWASSATRCLAWRFPSFSPTRRSSPRSRP